MEAAASILDFLVCLKITLPDIYGKEQNNRDCLENFLTDWKKHVVCAILDTVVKNPFLEDVLP